MKKGFSQHTDFLTDAFFRFCIFARLFHHKFSEFGFMSAIFFSVLFNQKITHNSLNLILPILIFNQIYDNILIANRDY